MDAIELMMEDQRRLATQFAGTRDTMGPHEAQALLCEIIRTLSVMATVEENLFYPAIAPYATETVLESLEEHHVIQFLLYELADMDPASERFPARLAVLREIVEQHLHKESRDLLPTAQRFLDGVERFELGRRMLDLRERLSIPEPRVTIQFFDREATERPWPEG